MNTGSIKIAVAMLCIINIRRILLINTSVPLTGNLKRISLSPEKKRLFTIVLTPVKNIIISTSPMKSTRKIYCMS
jgi:hypothetical protein